jgi:hypothetical protein
MTSIAGNRRRAPAFDLSAYGQELEAFSAELGAARWAVLTGASDELQSAEIYNRHPRLFSRESVDALRQLAVRDRDTSQARALLATAVDGYADLKVLDLTDQIASAEARAVIMWRGERIPYRQAPQRVAEMSDRAERNALEASYQEAVELINPLREARLDALHAVANELGYADYPAMIGETRGFDVEALAADMERFLIESETVYFAALRRYLAEIDIEQGDASNADLSRVLAGNGWNAWFEPRRMMAVLDRTLTALGIDPAAQQNVTLDIEARRTKAGGAAVVPVAVPQDIRIVLQPTSGNVDYAAMLHAIGHAQALAHVSAASPAAFRLAGDRSVALGYADLFALLQRDPAWLAEQLGMGDDEIVGWVDFAAFRRLHALRRDVAQLMYELRMHRDAESALHRAYYAGLLGLLTGVRFSESSYLTDVEHGFESAVRFRAACLGASLERRLNADGQGGWWQAPASVSQLKADWARGAEMNADTLVAHLGYDRLDWRPILRQIRTQLIGEMSGYGGPNITTRAGTRKV